jgi:hypothetical protein
LIPAEGPIRSTTTKTQTCPNEALSRVCAEALVAPATVGRKAQATDEEQLNEVQLNEVQLKEIEI